MFSPRMLARFGAPLPPRDLVALLRERAKVQPEAIAFEYLSSDENRCDNLTYAGLVARARDIADFLVRITIEPGSQVVLLYPQGLAAITALFGCFEAGVIAIPLPPPNATNRVAELPALLRRLRARGVLSTSAQLAAVNSQRGFDRDDVPIAWIPTDRIKPNETGIPSTVSVSAKTLALPLRTMDEQKDRPSFVTHGDVMERLSLAADSMGIVDRGPILSWLPFHHGQGLFHTVLLPLFLGVPGVLLDPNAFVANPIHWMHAMSRCRAVSGISPDFGYDLCVRTTAKEREGLDLSAWSMAVSVNHPVRPSLREKFAREFAPYGFREDAFDRGERVPEGLDIGGLRALPSSLLSIRPQTRSSTGIETQQAT